MCPPKLVFPRPRSAASPCPAASARGPRPGSQPQGRVLLGYREFAAGTGSRPKNPAYRARREPPATCDRIARKSEPNCMAVRRLHGFASRPRDHRATPRLGRRRRPSARTADSAPLPRAAPRRAALPRARPPRPNPRNGGADQRAVSQAGRHEPHRLAEPRPLPGRLRPPDALDRHRPLPREAGPQARRGRGAGALRRICGAEAGRRPRTPGDRRRPRAAGRRGRTQEPRRGAAVLRRPQRPRDGRGLGGFSRNRHARLEAGQGLAAGRTPRRALPCKLNAGGGSRTSSMPRSNRRRAGARPSSLREAPAVELAAQTLADEPGAVAASSPSGPVPGARIASRYRILERLGRGGMGVVYKAEDTRLRRHVALKFLPGDVARDARALARFRHEARSASALNHPNICTIYDVDEAAGETFITMEFLDGRTLSDRLAGRPLPPGLLVTWAEQIAEGLAAAHAAGIIHRDIKPANLFVTKQGRAKILDFGLAKPGAILDTAAEPPGEGPTLTSLAQWTQPGAVVGTVAYMSPEQLQALPLDARTDLFSFGAVLYEMATGVRAFPGGVPALVQDAILHRVPDPSRSLNPALPAEIERVIAKALEKDRNLRYQTAAEIRADLQRLRREMDSVGLPVAAGATARRLHRRTFLAAAALIVAAAAAGYLHWRRTPPLTAQDTVVLADFANQTGDPVFDGTLRQGLSVSLEQSPFLGVVSDDQIQQTLRLMGRPPETKLTPAVAREICQRTAGAAVLEGAIARIGDQYLLTLRAVNCASGRSLASAAATAADENHVLAALSSLSRAMRNKLGESLGTVEKFDAPLEQATTPSLEALQAFSSGIRVIDTQGSDAAIPFFQRAVALDPHFALAYAYLGIMENDVLETGKAAEYERKAYELRDRTSEVERDSITVTYHGHVTGNLEKAEQACALWLQAYPRAYHAHDVLAGMILPALGQYDRAAAEAAAAIRLGPDFTVAYAQRMWAEIALGRIDAARAVYAQAQARRLENPMLDIGLYEIEI